ncbi:cyclase family protein [Tissierella carlieri]|uniref:Cyclase family protein n=1 Tax=Tissierella carlieri TaxID=689904 RepID=A0ABT1SC49_9FIRM|nr:cyclase family protein [Tissierella carlieri]MBU5313212.1 cyclase family protein [Tissierella carlieri]MCQ4923932.1 cyclase family protein [Tissierella carlieri]MDU5081319.1 cyclase family protein [Bacillota bacterium]
MRKIIDLSISVENNLPSDPPKQIPQIVYNNHKDTAEEMARFFGNATVDDLPGGNGWAIEYVTLSTHTGTHIDAPYHFYPTMNRGERAWTIDEVPLDWFFGHGVIVDFRDKADGYKVTSKDFIEYFEKIDYKLKKGDIVLIMTGAPKYWGTERFLTAGCGMGKEATLWLIEQGVRVMGTDGWSWDIPLPLTGEEFNRTGDSSIIWEGHRAGMEEAYLHIEKLTNLDQLPITGSEIICLPIKIKDASAGWIRAVGIIEE